MSGKNKHRSANDYLQYLKGELSSRERFAFEKNLEADPFEQEAMEGLESLETGQTEQDILSLHNRLRKRLSRRRRVAFYSVAATVASLLIVGTVFLKIHDFNPGSDKEQLYPEESFDSGTPPEAQTIPPAEKEAAITAPVPTTPVPEGEPIKIVDQEVTEPERAETYDVVMADGPKAEVEESMMAIPAPVKEDVEEDQITLMEAEPVARAAENMADPGTQKSGRRKKSMAQPVAQSPEKVSNAPTNDMEMDQKLSGIVTGIVISAEDQGPISGAIVENRALNCGVYTDLDGQFDIPVQEDSPITLVASFIGMETQEYQVSDGAHVELVLRPDATTLDEVVVVGYEAQEEKGIEYNLPEPAIGTRKYKKYVEQNIEFPQVDTDLQRAIVVLKFKVTHTGEIKDLVALKSPGEAFTREATRLLMEGPAWNPASTEKGTKDVSVRMRIVFKR